MYCCQLEQLLQALRVEADSVRSSRRIIDTNCQYLNQKPILLHYYDDDDDSRGQNKILFTVKRKIKKK